MSEVVVLGSCGAFPEPGRACSGFLVEHEGFRVVLDLGYGTFPRLLTALGSSVADGLDAVIVTHHHPDHSIDLHALFRARWFRRRGSPRLPLYCPDGVVSQIAAVENDSVDQIWEVFDWHPLPAGPQPVGPFELRTWLLPHFVPNVGVRLSAPGVTIAYTGDTGPDPALAELGRDADLFIVDASDPEQREGGRDEPHLLLSATEAGRAGTAAGARRLLLTHFLPANDRDLTRTRAAAEFRNEVLLAEEGMRIPLP